MICYACNNDYPQVAPAPFYICSLCKGEARTMTEDEARKVITEWAKGHFQDEDEPEPDVEVVEITEGEDGEWEAELEVSTSADNPRVTFFMDDDPKFGLQIVTIDY